MEAHEPDAVVVRGVSHRYGLRVALDDVSLRLPIGETMAVVGPDGVGKSTLLGLIAGVRRLQAGSVEVLGGDMGRAAHRGAVAQRIAYMPQGLGRSLYPTLTVRENIEFAARLFGLSRGAREARMKRLLAATGLDPFPDRPAGKLSGGMKQKLALCCALIHTPDLLVLDEPTTGIDVLSRRQFWALVAALRSENARMTMLVATAYMEEAESFRRVAMMDDGRVLAAGPKDEVLAESGARSIEAAFQTLRGGGDGGRSIAFTIPPRPQHDGPAALRAEGLTRRFGRFTAVDNVSFSIERGEIFGFIGSNGCGKTTTMKMLTGLLPASAGRAWLLGRPVEASDVATRLRVGYMSQGFSLYDELTVRANLDLHARLYRLPPEQIEHRLAAVLDRFDLAAVADALPSGLPLGQLQRLQLAVACLHRPEVLILDEPTSGVDPAARDRFWQILADLSRKDGVTIFVSTHFMNEAERCDRVSLMHAGKVLAVGTPADIARQRHVTSLEDAFVGFIEEVEGSGRDAGTIDAGHAALAGAPPRTEAKAGLPVRWEAPRSRLETSSVRLWAFAYRETVELARDPIRIAFALIGPLILILTFGYGINFDVESLRFAALDRDRSTQSRQLVEAFAGSRYFIERPPVLSEADGQRRLSTGQINVLVSIPPGFGKDVLTGRRAEVGYFLDGASTFRAETARGYIDGIMEAYREDLARNREGPPRAPVPLSIESRFRYNQAFETVNAIMPGIIMTILAIIPAMLAAIGIVREREFGSIANLSASPATIGEFLIGKQLPYVVFAFLSFLMLVSVAVWHFGLSVKGSLTALLLAGLFYAAAMTAFGILVSSFVRSQIAAMIATAVICQVPALNFSGFLYPAAALEGPGVVIGHSFPALWFQNVSLGAFAKARSFAELAPNLVVLAGFAVVFMLLARLVMRKQEP